MTGKKIKVLLLEDEAAHAEVIRRGLESSDIAFQLQVVGTLKKYREHIAANLPDIALVDMVLPDGNGIDLLTSPPELNAFPILILTSHGDEKAAVEVLKAGALDYIVKSPETFSQMSRILSHNLKQWSLIRENKQAVQALQASETNFRNSMENSPLGTRIVSEDGETLYTNRAFLEIYGYRSLAEFNAAPVKDRYTPDSYVEFRERRDKRRRKEPLPDNYEVSIVRKNGDIRHLRVMRKEILWAGKQQYQTIYRDITGQKQAEEALKLSEERWKTVVGHAPVGIATLGQDGHIINANEAFCRILGYTEKELQQLTCKDLTHSEDVAESDRLMQKLLPGEESSFSQEKRYIKKDGTVITGKVIVNMIRDANGNPQLGISELEDITAQKKMELALRQSEQNFRNSIDSSPMGIYIITSAWDTLYANQAFLDIFGYKSIKEVIENPPHTYYTPESHALLEKRREAQKHGAAIPGKLDVSIQRKDGTIRYLHISRKQVIWNGAHQYQLFYDDITTGKQAQQALIASEVSYRRLFESAKDGILIIDAVTGLITDANPYLNKLLGLSLNEIKGKELWEIGTFADIVSSKERFEELRQKGYMCYEDLPLKTADGHQISVEFVSNVYNVEHRRVIQCNIRDITERKKADAALRTSEERYRLIVEKSNDVIFTFNAAGEFIYISPAIKNGLGYNPSDLIGHTFSSLIHPEDLLRLQQAIQRNVKDGFQSPGGNEYRIRHASGEWRWHNASGNAVYDAGGKFVNFVGIARDITERKQIAMKLDDLHRIMRLVTEINQLIVKIDNEKELLQQACNQLIRSQRYPLAWISFKQEGSHSILPFVQCGEKADYLAAVNITWDDSKFGRGPTGVAIRTGKPDVMGDIAHDPRFAPWREQALKRGFQSSVAIPLTIQEKVIGAVTIYSVSKESFGSDELELLVELSGDLSVGVEKIRRRAAQLKLEEELKLSEQNFRNSMDNALFGIRIVDINSETLYANRALLDIFGYCDFEEIKSKPPKNFFTPESYQAFVTRQNKWSRGESNIGKYEVDIIRKDGAVRHLNVFTKDVFWNGKPELQIYYQDVSEMKQAEEILKTSEQNLHTALDKLPVGCRITDVNDNTLYLNQEFLVIFGYANAEEVALKPPLKDFYTPESYAGYLVRTEKMLRGEPREDPVEVDIIRKDGSPRRLQLFHTDLIWNGKPEFETIYRDITENVQAEAALKLSEQNFRNSMDGSTLGLRIMGDADQTLYANQAMLDIFGYRNIQELKDNPPQKYYTAESRAFFEERKAKFARGEALPERLEFDIIRNDGAVRHLQLASAQVLWNGKQQYQIIYTDITDRVEAEKALTLSEQNFRNTLDSSLMGIFIGHSGKVLYVNKAFLEMFGYDNIAEVTATRPVKFYSPESYALYLQHEEKQKHGEPEEDKFEIDIVRKDGSRRHLEAYRQEVLWDNKLRSQIIYNDVTSLKLAEEERQRLEDKAQVASRLAVVGEMAAGVAHEINNPLTGVLGFSQMLLEKENVPEEIKAELRLIVDGSQRVADIVKRLLTFARQTKPVKTMTNINELIDNTLKLREYVLKTVNINVVTRFDPELPWSVADPGQLQQVFLNLIVNAEQAMKTAHGRGTLTVTTEKKGNDIFLSFQDDGPGIKFEDLKRLFEPFFTTKAPGEGTGLGLSLSRSIILEHNGSMRVESEFGRGANFIIELPIIESLPSEAAVLMSPVQKKPAETKHGKILVVDDEPGVRILLERVFIQMGHQVDTVADAETAVNKLDAGSTYDIILTDVRMPGMSGIELHTHILEKSPAMKNKIIFITGDVMGADIKEFLVKNNLTYFAKPFDIEALKAKINRLMLSLPLSNDSA